MINKNDFKYIIKKIIIGLVIAFILFNINKCNAYALVLKQTLWAPAQSEGFSGTLSNGTNFVNSTNFNTPISVNSVKEYDVLVFKFGNETLQQNDNFSFSGTIGSNGGTYCKSYTQRGSSYICEIEYNIDNNQSTYISMSTNSGIIYIQAALFYDNDSGIKSTCYMTDDLKDMIVCPIYKKDVSNITGYEINIRNGGFDTLYYNISINGLKYLWNYESTEIVNGLSSVQYEQQNTTQAIEDLTDNINDSNISGANSSTNNALSSINNNVSTTLDSTINANTLNTLLTSFVNQLSNSTCSPIILPIPFTTENITLPCLGTEFSQKIPVIWSLYELIITGVIVLRFWQHAVEFILNILDPYHIGANNVPTGGGK